VLWLIVVAVAGPLSGKLTGAEKNGAKASLSGAAESTKILDLQARFSSPNVRGSGKRMTTPRGDTGAASRPAAPALTS
jgi:putative drug exporter of the RND superfamily